jgi:predicted dehydrogenase
VLCEKPISNNIEEARQMVAKAREKVLCSAST